MITAKEVLNGKILIVDDQPANIALLEQMLRGAGYRSVDSLTDSTQVCELHLFNRYDLILLDLQMPGMDGFQVMENLKEIETDGYLPVLVITAQPNHKLRALKAGAKDFVSKPFDLAEVLLRVHNMLEVRLLHLRMKTLYQRVLSEQRLSERLLLEGLPHALPHPLPHALAEEMQGRAEAPVGYSGLVKGSFAELTMLFSDTVALTSFLEGTSAKVLAGVLDSLSARLDGQTGASVEPRGLDLDIAYLAAFGLPEALANHSIHAAQRVLDLAEAVECFNGHSSFRVKVRIGLDEAATPRRPRSRKGLKRPTHSK